VDSILIEDLLTEKDGYVKIIGGIIVHGDLIQMAELHDQYIRKDFRKKIDREYSKILPKPKSKSAEVLAHAKAFYTYQDAAIYFGKTLQAIKQHVYRGELTPIECLGRKGFLKSDLDRLIQASRNSTRRRS
jgi:hypothetical protein